MFFNPHRMPTQASTGGSQPSLHNKICHGVLQVPAKKSTNKGMLYFQKQNFCKYHKIMTYKTERLHFSWKKCTCKIQCAEIHLWETNIPAIYNELHNLPAICVEEVNDNSIHMYYLYAITVQTTKARFFWYEYHIYSLVIPHLSWVVVLLKT